MPQPYSKVRTRGKVHLGKSDQHPFDRHPILAVKAMRVIADWAKLENRVGYVLVTMLGTNPAPAAAMFGALTSNAAQTAAMRAVADLVLGEAEKELFEALMSLFSSAAKERNKIAHWIWGHADNLENELLLFDPVVLLNYNVILTEFLFSSAPFTLLASAHKIPPFPDDKVLVYTATDFENLSTRIVRLTEHFQQFDKLLVPHGNVPAYDALCAEPEVQEVLARRRGRQRTEQEAQPQSQSEYDPQ